MLIQPRHPPQHPFQVSAELCYRNFLVLQTLDGMFLVIDSSMPALKVLYQWRSLRWLQHQPSPIVCACHCKYCPKKHWKIFKYFLVVHSADVNGEISMSVTTMLWSLIPSTEGEIFTKDMSFLFHWDAIL